MNGSVTSRCGQDAHLLGGKPVERLLVSSDVW